MEELNTRVINVYKEKFPFVAKINRANAKSAHDWCVSNIGEISTTWTYVHLTGTYYFFFEDNKIYTWFLLIWQ